jgi:hypothetical protein
MFAITCPRAIEHLLGLTQSDDQASARGGCVGIARGDLRCLQPPKRLSRSGFRLESFILDSTCGGASRLSFLVQRIDASLRRGDLHPVHCIGSAGVQQRRQLAVYTADSTQDGAIHLRPVTFATAGWHRIKIDIATAFWGVNIGPTDTWIPTPSTASCLLVIGDSYGGGTGSTGGFSGYPQTLGLMLGYTNTYSYSVGGTGLLTAPTYRSRSADWAAVNATAALIQMSINDDGQTTANIAAEMALLVPIVKALPTVKDVWIMGTCAKGGSKCGCHPGQGANPGCAGSRARRPLHQPRLTNPTMDGIGVHRSTR